MSSRRPRKPEPTVNSEYDWAFVVERIMHPMKIKILETMWELGEGQSAARLNKRLKPKDTKDAGVSYCAYHLSGLLKAGVIEVVGERPVRGARETFYYPLSDRRFR